MVSKELEFLLESHAGRRKRSEPRFQPENGISQSADMSDHLMGETRTEILMGATSPHLEEECPLMHAFCCLLTCLAAGLPSLRSPRHVFRKLDLGQARIGGINAEENFSYLEYRELVIWNIENFS